MKTKIKFPFVDSYGDYHEIEELRDDLNEIFTKTIKCKEVAFDGNYWGLFYVGKLPKKSTVKKLLLEAGWADNLEHSEFKM